MIGIEVSTLAKIIEAKTFGKKNQDVIAAVSTDTRTIGAGDCFFAISGPNFDGHNFISEALAKGACCAVSNKDIVLPVSQQHRLLVVIDTIKALGQLAAWYRKQLSPKVIAITGSAGKTTTRHIIHHVLSKFCRCHQAAKSFNNHIGLPLTILSAKPEDEAMILELGTNHPGEIGYLTRIAQPDIALVTCAAPAHLEGFGSLEKIIAEKLSISEGLSESGMFIVNGDQGELVCYTMGLGRPYLMFGTDPACDFRGENLKFEGEGGSLNIDGLTIESPLPGRANLMNILAAWSVCNILGLTISDFASSLSDLKPVSMRMNIETVGPIKIINDCYNANPASMANALDCLTTLSQKENRRAVFVAGCMGELGEASGKLHFELGQKAAQTGVAFLVAGGPFASDIAGGAARAGLDVLCCKTFADTHSLCDSLHRFVRPADIILIKGSRSAGMEKAVEQLRKLFTP